MDQLYKKLTKDDIKVSRDTKLVIEYISIDLLMPNDYNPNTHNTDSFDLLLKSIEYFGFTQPIVVNKRTMTIVDGEHRFRAACVLGFEEIPVCFVDFDDVKLKFATIIHNAAKGRENKKLMDDLMRSLPNAQKVLLKDR